MLLNYYLLLYKEFLSLSLSLLASLLITFLLNRGCVLHFYASAERYSARRASVHKREGERNRTPLQRRSRVTFARYAGLEWMLLRGKCAGVAVRADVSLRRKQIIQLARARALSRARSHSIVIYESLASALMRPGDTRDT